MLEKIMKKIGKSIDLEIHIHQENIVPIQEPIKSTNDENTISTLSDHVTDKYAFSYWRNNTNQLFRQKHFRSVLIHGAIPAYITKKVEIKPETKEIVKQGIFRRKKEIVNPAEYEDRKVPDFNTPLTLGDIRENNDNTPAYLISFQYQSLAIDSAGRNVCDPNITLICNEEDYNEIMNYVRENPLEAEKTFIELGKQYAKRNKISDKQDNHLFSHRIEKHERQQYPETQIENKRFLINSIENNYRLRNDKLEEFSGTVAENIIKDILDTPHYETKKEEQWGRDLVDKYIEKIVD